MEPDEGRRGTATSRGLAVAAAAASVSASSSQNGDIITLDDRRRCLSARLRVHRSLGGRRVLRRLEPLADADGERPGGLDGVRGEDRAAGTGGDARDRGEAADGDEHGGEGRHHLGVLGREEVERVAGIEQPDGRLGDRRGGHCGRGMA